MGKMLIFIASIISPYRSEHANGAKLHVET